MNAAAEPEAPAMPTASSYRWVMLALICVAYAAFGMVQTSIAPLITPILRDTGMTRSQMGLALGSWQFVYLFVAIPAGAMIDRFGLRRAIFAGVLFVAASQALRASAVSEVTMLAGVMVFGLGGPFISIGAPKLTSTWFGEHEVGMALGIYTVSQSIGALIATSSANAIVMPLVGQSWRATLLVYGAIALLAGLAWVVLAREPEGVERTAATGPRAMLAGFARLLRVPLVQIVLVMAVGVFVFNHSFTNWLPEMLRSRGMDGTTAGVWASVPTIVAIPAALVIPRFTTRRWLIPVLVLVFGVWSLSALALPAAQSGWSYWLIMIGLGIGRGAATPLLMLMLLRSKSVGAALMGAAGGLYFTAGEVGGVLGPYLTGMLADATGGFGTGLVVLAGAAATLAGLTLILRAVADRPAPAR